MKINHVNKDLLKFSYFWNIFLVAYCFLSDFKEEINRRSEGFTVRNTSQTVDTSKPIPVKLIFPN